jgi:PTH1 family peptidyl-tRNA hydrolase
MPKPAIMQAFGLLNALQNNMALRLKKTQNFNGMSGRGNIEGHDVRLLLPTTFMNRVWSKCCSLRKILSILLLKQYLIAHDELDMNPGVIRLKTGGGHGGHNGLRDIVPHIGPNFHRLRIGIGHPGSKERVSGHVLGKAPSSEQDLMDAQSIMHYHAVKCL